MELSRKKRYQAYLRSDHWLKLRAEKLAVEPECERCGYGSHLHVHHRTYPDDWEMAVLDDLETLCAWCHAKEHRIRNRRKRVPLKVRRQRLVKKQNKLEKQRKFIKRLDRHAAKPRDMAPRLVRAL